jgi:hypothetical protein
MARAAQPDWAVSVLGGPVQIALVMRTGALLADPIWGPTLRRSFDKRKSGNESAGSAGPDVVRGGVPPRLDPLALGGKNGLATWRAPGILPSGVAEYAPNPNANGYVLYVIPGGTWVLVDGATAPRANRVFAQNLY